MENTPLLFLQTWPLVCIFSFRFLPSLLWFGFCVHGDKTKSPQTNFPSNVFLPPPPLAAYFPPLLCSTCFLSRSKPGSSVSDLLFHTGKGISQNKTFSTIWPLIHTKNSDQSKDLGFVLFKHLLVYIINKVLVLRVY